MSQPPPPPFPSPFAGPPPGHFRGRLPPPPPPFFPHPFPPGGAGGGPRPCLPYPPGPPWRPEAAASAALPGGGARRASEAGETEAEEARWLSRFLARRRTREVPPPPPPQAALGPSPSEVRRVAVAALRQVAGVAALCRAWRGGAAVEEAAAAEAEGRLAELREMVRPLLHRPATAADPRQKKRLRRARGRQEAREARQEAAARRAQREAVIDRWRARRAQEVEDKHREQELKAAADSVLSEVRKKQADTKRMAEILRGLEKLRKLRKEAAGRKGVCPPPEADEAFENEIQSLKALIKQRTEVYEAEEWALRVMLEGEQEEERKREMEKKQKKEKEKLQQQKREMDSKLFGDPEESPLYHHLQPYRQYYLQAEYSVPALIQIRREWDRFLVSADHPDGSFIPPGWILPSAPSSDIWGTAVR